MILLTGVIGIGSSGITQEIGQFNDDNGLFFRIDDGIAYVVRRTKTSGSVVDNSVAQSSWNIDAMDGTGNSGITIDFDKTQIFIIDYEWLGVGRVRMGFVIGGSIYYCHEFLNSNVLTVVYMSTPNLPLRYSIENDGTGAASTLDHICSTVISEGGQQDTGMLRHQDTGAISGLLTSGIYALLGIRLKSTHIGSAINMVRSSIAASSTND